MNDRLTLPHLPDVTLHTARAGHVAGAISVGIESPHGRLIVSGDVSMVPQRTILGAELPGLRHPDLLVLESTYGSRMHPNRQAEEERLAQAVAAGIERGGHVLIPAFALGRAQEVLRILHLAQRKGSIPEFPIWVDGLVRRVCATYTAIPEALAPPLQRQIHKGYPPFFTGTVRAVNSPKQRERIIDSEPSCIVSSSGMLTGGPSAFYAARLAENEQASILITGYQDEESPGRKLLAMAEQKGGTLELNERTVTVRCNFDRYNLSAHADGAELTALVSALKPKRVALVHGDPEARAALAGRMQRLAEVFTPTDGEAIPVQVQRANKPKARKAAPDTSRMPEHGIGNGAAPTPDTLQRLWQAVTDGSSTQVVSLRELALTWYGSHAAGEEETAVQRAVAQDQHYFIPLPDLPGMLRVRTPDELSDSHPQDAPKPGRMVQPGALLLLRGPGAKLTPALCIDARMDAVWVYQPGNSSRRRFPRPAVVEVVGMWPDYPVEDTEQVRNELAALAKAAQRWQRQQPISELVPRMQPGRSYSLDDAATLAELAPDDLAGRLGLALYLNSYPDLIVRQEGSGLLASTGTYVLHENWQAALRQGIEEPRPDQTAILSIIESHIGSPDDLYRRSVNPDTGAVTLSFHFPEPARQQHGAAIDAAAAEAGVPITIAPQPHQGALTDAAREVLPPELSVLKTSLRHPEQKISLRCAGRAPAAARHEARERFHARTGWTLDIDDDSEDSSETQQPPPPASDQPALDMHQAVSTVRAALGSDSGCYKVSADQQRRVLQVRFHFPDIAQQRYAEQLAALSAQTGWQVTVYPEPHQGELEALARRVLPSGLRLTGAPSLYRGERQAVVRCRGSADQQAISAAADAFAEASGWRLVIQTSK
jgi:Cft2 family RNA processing exonuclease